MENLVTLFSQLRKDLQGIIKTLANLSKTQEQVLLEKWIRKERAVKALGISSRTFQRLTTSGQLPFSKVNGIVFIKITDLDELLNNNYKS